MRAAIIGPVEAPDRVERFATAVAGHVGQAVDLLRQQQRHFWNVDADGARSFHCCRLDLRQRFEVP